MITTSFLFIDYQEAAVSKRYTSERVAIAASRSSVCSEFLPLNNGAAGISGTVV